MQLYVSGPLYENIACVSGSGYETKLEQWNRALTVPNPDIPFQGLEDNSPLKTASVPSTLPITNSSAYSHT